MLYKKINGVKIMTDDTDDLPLTAKIIIWLAVIIWAIWYMSGGEERRKEWKKK